MIEIRCKKCGKLLLKVSEEAAQIAATRDAPMVEVLCDGRSRTKAGMKRGERCNTLNTYPSAIERQ